MARWTSVFRRIELWSAWVRMSGPLLVSILSYWLLPAHWPLLTRLTAAWDLCAVLTIGLTWGIMLSASIVHIRRMANREDPGRKLTFLFVLVAAVASLLAVVLLLSATHEGPTTLRTANSIVALLAVLLAWLLVHTVFTLRYAHLYYDGEPGSEAGGLEFPGNEAEPDYLDFAYYAFVVGMTAQTADVSISGRTIRRLTLLHGILSFGFNTAVVALSINGLANTL